MLKNHVFQTFETAILHVFEIFDIYNVFEIFTSEKKTFVINIFCDEYLEQKKDSPKTTLSDYFLAILFSKK